MSTYVCLFDILACMYVQKPSACHGNETSTLKHTHSKSTKDIREDASESVKTLCLSRFWRCDCSSALKSSGIQKPRYPASTKKCLQTLVSVSVLKHSAELARNLIFPPSRSLLEAASSVYVCMFKAHERVCIYVWSPRACMYVWRPQGCMYVCFSSQACMHVWSLSSQACMFEALKHVCFSARLIRYERCSVFDV